MSDQPRDPAAALAAEMLTGARGPALDEIVRAAERAASTAQATNAEMIAASAFLLASALVDEQDQCAAYHAAHVAMTRSCLARLLAAREKAAAEAAEPRH